MVVHKNIWYLPYNESIRAGASSDSFIFMRPCPTAIFKVEKVFPILPYPVYILNAGYGQKILTLPFLLVSHYLRK